MDERQLKYLSLACSIAGLLVLSYAASNIQHERADIKSISLENLGNTAKACGQISSKRVSNNHIFFKINDSTGSINFIIFNTTALRLNESGTDIYNFSAGEAFCAPGIVSEYPKGSGQLELIYRSGKIERANV